jgi:hypothetical protein
MELCASSLASWKLCSTLAGVKLALSAENEDSAILLGAWETSVSAIANLKFTAVSDVAITAKIRNEQKTKWDRFPDMSQHTANMISRIWDACAADTCCGFNIYRDNELDIFISGAIKMSSAKWTDLLCALNARNKLIGLSWCLFS